MYTCTDKVLHHPLYYYIHKVFVKGGTNIYIATSVDYLALLYFCMYT